MKKKDIVLVTVTILLVIALIFGYVWDINKFVLGRTLNIEITDELEIDSVRKYGMLFYRSSYEAKLKMSRDNAEKILADIMTQTGEDAMIYSYESFLEYKNENFKKEYYQPNPEYGTEVAVVQSRTPSGDYATYMIDVEDQTTAYVYVYFARANLIKLDS